jgi:release factor glutamine methyltransferase
MTTIAQALREAVERLTEQPDTARLDAEVLLTHVLDKPRSHLYAWPERTLSPAELTRFETLLARRVTGEPVAHLTGRREFWSLPLRVPADTLIPRPETEILVEQTLAVLPPNEPLRVADLGTGSGAVALALARERQRWQLFALDRSPACIRVARHNAEQLGIDSPRFLVGHWSAALAAASLDAIVSNPPYVKDSDTALETGDVRFEPSAALRAGADGLDDIRQLIDDAPRVLRDTGHIFLEHAPEQADEIRRLLINKGFIAIATSPDLGGRERVTQARRGP